MIIEIDVEFDKRGSQVNDSGAKGFLEIMRFEHEGFQKIVIEDVPASPESVKFLGKHYSYLPQSAKDEICAAFPEVTKVIDSPRCRLNHNAFILFSVTLFVLYWLLKFASLIE